MDLVANRHETVAVALSLTPADMKRPLPAVHQYHDTVVASAGVLDPADASAAPERLGVRQLFVGLIPKF